MSPDMSRALRKIRDASYASEAWPEALKSLTDGLGVPVSVVVVLIRLLTGTTR